MSNTHLVTLSETEQFFYDHAGWSYDPAIEKSSSGKVRNAILLAAAEKAAKLKNWVVRWEIDYDADITPTDQYFVSGAQHWQAALYEPDNDYSLAALGSIDLGFANGEDGEPASPHDNPYARVIEAELASEAQS